MIHLRVPPPESAGFCLRLSRLELWLLQIANREWQMVKARFAIRDLPFAAS
jgi:hypothetical protein